MVAQLAFVYAAKDLAQHTRLERSQQWVSWQEGWVDGEVEMGLG